MDLWGQHINIPEGLYRQSLVGGAYIFVTISYLLGKICRTLLVTGWWYAYLFSTSQHSSSPQDMCVQGAVGNDDTIELHALRVAGGWPADHLCRHKLCFQWVWFPILDQLLHCAWRGASEMHQPIGLQRFLLFLVEGIFHPHHCNLQTLHSYESSGLALACWLHCSYANGAQKIYISACSIPLVPHQASHGCTHWFCWA